MSDVTIRHGDMREVLREFPDAHFDSVVTDPPYHLTNIVKRFGADNAAPVAYARASAGFMGRVWDGGDIAFRPKTYFAYVNWPDFLFALWAGWQPPMWGVVDPRLDEHGCTMSKDAEGEI